ncbi:IS3 family transposase [Saccharicrinis aurantiacus]|uniref:IS3 family transposase n=1 Tax=Saccharicrinis aurantiacus TaxID=1849719 RepID=UPI0024917A0E|nr:IS3 family transposase [Saccharicrinis aurantiacus]
MYPLSTKSVICGLFGYSRQAWYDSKKRHSRFQMEEVFILKQVKVLRQEHKRMGGEKLHLLLKPVFEEHGIKYGRDKFYNLLSEHGLLVRRRRRNPRTTNSNHFYRRYPNLIRDMELYSSGRLWVSDITYIRTTKGFVYLSLITDAYSKKIVGWCLWPSLSSEGALNALKMAVSAEGVRAGLIHHSDRGIQYCCNDYVNYLKGAKIDISMTENGDPYENAIAERINGILKDEYELAETFSDYQSALEAVKTAVYKYNNKRPHRSVDMLFPIDAHEQKGLLKKHWKKRSYKQKQETGIDEKSVRINQEEEKK